MQCPHAASVHQGWLVLGSQVTFVQDLKIGRAAHNLVQRLWSLEPAQLLDCCVHMTTGWQQLASLRGWQAFAECLLYVQLMLLDEVQKTYSYSHTS